MAAKKNTSSDPAYKNYDTIRINDLVLPVYLYSGAQWPLDAQKPVEQPVSISLSIFHDVAETAQSDELEHSINYADIAKHLRDVVMHRKDENSFLCLQDLSRHICNVLGAFSSLSDILDGLEVHVKVKQLKPPLHSKAVSVEHFARFSSDGSWTPQRIKHLVEDILCPVIVGVEVAERLEKQDVVVNLSIDTGEQGLSPQDWIDIRSIIQTIYEKISSSNYLTLEALTSFVASGTLSLLKSFNRSPIVIARVAKPSALVLAESAEVEVLRTFDNYPMNDACPDADTIEDIAVAVEHDDKSHTIAIALGSNLGDSFKNIEYALCLLEKPDELLGGDDMDPFVTVVNTSFLYESAPMYVTDQPSFINCACMVETNLAPITLLRLLKQIELTVGRVPSIRNGPRAVDLDVVFYDDRIIDTRPINKDPEDVEGELIVPHPRVQEREFALRPLNDMIPDYVHPTLKKSIATLFREVWTPSSAPMNKVIPFPRLPISSSTSSQINSTSPSDIPDTLTHWKYPSTIHPSITQQPGLRNTHVMATLNTTPDSFSDGAQHDALPAALQYACSSVSVGATVVDIGGYSTRPGAAFVSVADEIERVVPAINAIRDADALNSILSGSTSSSSSVTDDNTIQKVTNVLISVDTFRWQVAEAALRAGANCINDVYAFSGSHSSWPLVSEEDKDVEEESMAKMKALARKYVAPVVLMHSRGDAGKNKDYSQYDYVLGANGAGGGSDNDGPATLEGVRIELGNKVDKIVRGKGGVRRWLVIVDPGVGFSKSLQGNLELLRNGKEVVADVLVGGGPKPYRNPLVGYPQLIGTSRKSFLGAILAQDPFGRQTEPKERSWATAAAVTCAVQQEALIVRVHDVQEMVDVVKVAQALWP